MTKKELKEMVRFNMSLHQNLPRKKKKFYRKAVDLLVKELIENNLHVKIKCVYPFLYPQKKVK
jgi:hypothetical protein